MERRFEKFSLEQLEKKLKLLLSVHEKVDIDLKEIQEEIALRQKPPETT